GRSETTFSLSLDELRPLPREFRPIAPSPPLGEVLLPCEDRSRHSASRKSLSGWKAALSNGKAPRLAAIPTGYCTSVLCAARYTWISVFACLIPSGNSGQHSFAAEANLVVHS